MNPRAEIPTLGRSRRAALVAPTAAGQRTAVRGAKSRCIDSEVDAKPHQRVDIGEVAASAQPRLFHTVLGSCVAVCLRDPISRVGGMNHILVPGSNAQEAAATRCGVQAMELLINELMKLGADRRRLVAKAFGGGNVIRAFRSPTVGEQNAGFVREFLRTEQIPLIAERMGGNKAVLVNFHSDNGKASIHTVDGSRLPEIVRAETRYLRKPLADRFNINEPTIF